MYVICLKPLHGIESMLTSFVHSITDDEGNAWQTPQSDDQDPQVSLQYMKMGFSASLRKKFANPCRYFIDPARVPGHSVDLPSQVPDLCAVQVRLCRRCRLLGKGIRRLLMVEGDFLGHSHIRT